MNEPIFFNYFSNHPENQWMVLEHFSLYQAEEEPIDEEPDCVRPLFQINSALPPLPFVMVLSDIHIPKEEIK